MRKILMNKKGEFKSQGGINCFRSAAVKKAAPIINKSNKIYKAGKYQMAQCCESCDYTFLSPNYVSPGVDVCPKCGGKIGFKVGRYIYEIKTKKRFLLPDKKVKECVFFLRKSDEAKDLVLK